MNKFELQDRTKKFAINVIRLVKELPKVTEAFTISNMIIRSSTSVASNYRAACRAKSTKDFISKMGIVEEEADETVFLA